MRHTHSRIGGSIIMYHADSKWQPDAAQFFMAPQFIRRSSCSSLFRRSHTEGCSRADNRPCGHRPAIRQSSAEPGAVKVWRFSERFDSSLPNVESCEKIEGRLLPEEACAGAPAPPRWNVRSARVFGCRFRKVMEQARRGSIFSQLRGGRDARAPRAAASKQPPSSTS